jgi:8-oxo-dGTP pyrophosphatase MutT (NUDIX family)
MDLSQAQLERRLAAHGRSVRTPRPGRRAAVAALLRYRADAPEVLLMQRSECTGDRWSGQVSMPGGREEPHDPDLVATAVRETREEVGVDLQASARLVAPLEPMRAVARGRVLPMTISPFVFVQTDEVSLALNHEASAAFWLPLDRAAAGELDSTYEWGIGPVSTRLPCWRFEGFVVWGLTYRMLSSLITVVR